MTALVLATMLALHVHEEARYLMGTLVTVRAEAESMEVAEAACDAAFDELSRLESILSTWQEDSDISRLNAAPADSCVAVAPELIAVLLLALQVAENTAGAFDPTVLPLVRAWGLRGGPARVPPPEELEALRARVGFGLIRVEPEAGCAGHTADGVEVDLGGIAKGWALDQAREVMKGAGATAGVLDLGGNLLVFGQDTDRTVLVASPDSSGGALAEIPIREAAVATSGQYERFVEIDGVKHGHILNPRSGRPVARRGSVTAMAPEGWLADALSTAAFVLGPEAGPWLTELYPEADLLFVVEDDEGEWTLVQFPPGEDSR